MLFRIWFLYVCKLGIIAFAMVVAAALFSNRSWAPALHLVGMSIMIPVALAGALLGSWVTIVSDKMRCPICDSVGRFAMYQRRPGVDCSKCGVVTAKSVARSFQVVAVPTDEPRSRKRRKV